VCGYDLRNLPVSLKFVEELVSPQYRSFDSVRPKNGQTLLLMNERSGLRFLTLSAMRLVALSSFLDDPCGGFAEVFKPLSFGLVVPCRD